MIQGKGGNGITKRTWSSIFLLGFLAQGILRLDPEGLSWKRRYHARERILHNQIGVIIKTIRNGPAKQAYLLAEPEAQRAALPAAVWPSLKIQGAAGYDLFLIATWYQSRAKRPNQVRKSSQLP
jgi:hypothetical protein